MPMKMTNPKQIAEVMTIRKLQKELDKAKLRIVELEMELELARQRFARKTECGLE